MKSKKKTYIAPEVQKLNVIEVAQKLDLKLQRKEKFAFPIPALVLKAN